MNGIHLTIDFDGKKTADFEISALIGLDIIATVILLVQKKMFL